MKQKSIDNKYINHVECVRLASFNIVDDCAYVVTYSKKVHFDGYKRFQTLNVLKMRPDGFPYQIECFYYNSWLECLFKFITLLRNLIYISKSDIVNLRFYNEIIYSQFQRYWNLVLNKAVHYGDDIDRLLVPYIPESAKPTKSK